MIWFPYYKKIAYPAGIYRVGPWARLNVADGITTPLANKELQNYKEIGNNGILQESLYFHYARMIEALCSAEMVKLLLQNDLICGKDIWVDSKVKHLIAFCEQPFFQLFKFGLNLVRVVLKNILVQSMKGCA